MKEQLVALLRHAMSQNNKRFYILILAVLLGIVTYFKKKKYHKQMKYNLRLKKDQYTIRQILKELQIEANFVLNVAYLKYKDKLLLNKDIKKQQLVNEFNSLVLCQQLRRYQLDIDRYEEVLEQSPELKKAYKGIIDQFNSFKDSKPQILDIYINKFNSQSLKLILKKYLAYLRYLTYHQTKTFDTYMQRFDQHLKLLTEEKHLKEIFDLYIMNFDEHNPEFDRTKGCYFREFKKAYYQLLFDKQWCDDVFDIEQQHIGCISLILEFGKELKSDYLQDNPIERRQADYGITYDIPEEILLTIGQQTKDAIKYKYLTLMADRMNKMTDSIIVNQIFNVNPMLTKLRKLRDKINYNQSSSKNDKSQDSGSTTGHPSSTKNSTRRKQQNYIPLADRLKQNLPQQVQQQINTLEINSSLSLIDNTPLLISEKIIQEDIQPLETKNSSDNVFLNDGKVLNENQTYLDESVITQKKVFRMMYRTWSAITKSIKASLYKRQAPIEVPNFAIFIPFKDQKMKDNEYTDDILLHSNKTTLHNKFLSETKVKVLINDNFFKSCGAGLTIFSHSSEVLSNYNPANINNIRTQIKDLTTLNMQSVASICQTDLQTVELVWKEILVNIAQLVSKGQSIRLNLKVGRLIFRNSLVSFKQIDEETTNTIQKFNQKSSMRRSLYDNKSTRVSQSELQYSGIDNLSRLGSVNRKEISVITPSLADQSKSVSVSQRSYHVSNPNPQQGQPKYQGIRESGYMSLQTTPKEKQNLDFLRFGKKIVFNNRMSSKDLVEEHLKQIRENALMKQQLKDNNKKTDRDFLTFVSQQIASDKLKQQQSVEQVKKEFLDYNNKKQIENKEQTEYQDKLKQEKSFFFPFTYGDKVEDKQKELRSQLRSEWQKHLEQTKANETQNSFYKQHIRSSSELGFYNVNNRDNDNVSLISKSVINDQDMLNSRYKNNKHIRVGSLIDTSSAFTERNKLLMPQDSPQKQAVLKAAQDRFHERVKSYEVRQEKEVKSQQEYDELLRKKQEEKLLKKVKDKQLIKEILSMQKDQKNQMENLTISESRQLYATHFGPEEKEEDLKRMFDLEQQKKKIMKFSLIQQIGEKERQKKRMLDLSLQQDKFINDQVKELQNREKQIRIELHQQQKQHLKEEHHQNDINLGKGLPEDNDIQEFEGFKEKKKQMLNSTYINPYNTAIFGDTLLDVQSDDEELDHSYKNKYEQLLPMNKHSLIALFNRLKSTNPNDGKWDTKLNEDNIKVSIKMKGSELTKDFPLIWSEMFFEPGTDLQKLMRAIHNASERMQWDKDIEQAEILQIPNHSVLLWYQKNKSAIKVVNQRDFLEKKLKFKDGEKQFVFFSSIPDDLKPAQSDVTRAYTLIGFHEFEALDDGRIKFTGLMQNDLSLTGTMGKIGAAAVLNQLPKSLKAWYTLLVNHVKQMEDIVEQKTQQPDTQ